MNKERALLWLENQGYVRKCINPDSIVLFESVLTFRTGIYFDKNGELITSKAVLLKEEYVDETIKNWLLEE